MKTTLLIDTAINAVLDIHVTTTRKHDTQIGPSLVRRNAESIEVLAGDKRYDDQNLRQHAREYDIRPLVKHREFTSLHKAWNARLDSDLCHRRNMNETVNAAIKQKVGAFVRSRVCGSSSANSSSSTSSTTWDEDSLFRMKRKYLDSERHRLLNTENGPCLDASDSGSLAGF